MFTEQQISALSANLDRSAVKQRTQSGRQLSYIEGWHAIAEANRIFGFDGWTRETTEIRCVAEHERSIGQRGDKGWGVTYIAKVRVTVRATDRPEAITTIILREGCGTGHGIDRDLGQAHESALKEAETDAMKRALMTFGNPFGLALYDKEQAHVGDAAEPARTADKAPSLADQERYVSGATKALRLAKTKKDLLAWWAAEKPNRDKFQLDPTKGPGRQLMDAYTDHADSLNPENMLMAG